MAKDDWSRAVVVVGRHAGFTTVLPHNLVVLSKKNHNYLSRMSK
jgi:hypothetical protein